MKKVLIVIGVILALYLVTTYPVYVAIAAVLAIGGFIAYKVIKKRKAAQAPAEVSASEPAPEKPKLEIHSYEVKGLSYHEHEIFQEMVDLNPEYDYTKKEMIEYSVPDSPIFKWVLKPGMEPELIPEPDNKYDPNAVKVVLGGHLIGYIPKENCPEVLDMLNSGRIQSVKCFFEGGKYKKLVEDYDYEKDKSTYTVEDDYRIPGAEISIRCTPAE